MLPPLQPYTDTLRVGSLHYIDKKLTATAPAPERRPPEPATNQDPTTTTAPASEPILLPEPAADTTLVDHMEDVQPSTSQARIQLLLEQIIELAGPQAMAAAGQFADKLAQLGIIHTCPEQVPMPAPTSERAPLDPQAQPFTPQAQPPKSSRNVPIHTRAIIVRGIPTSRKIGKVWRWMEEDNKGIRLKIIGARWLLQEARRVGKLASSVVLYLASGVKA